jgi:NAD(P)H-dependent FMN reductase
MSILVVSTSSDPRSRSRRLANFCLEDLRELGCESSLLDLRKLKLPLFDNDKVYGSALVRDVWHRVFDARGVVLVSPTYNWGCSSELKRLIEITGSTDKTLNVRSAWFDKILTFVNSAGVPHSYMAFGSLALSMMLDYKCVINPYNVYIHYGHWQKERLREAAGRRIRKSMMVMKQLVELLGNRAYSSGWEI